ncbi:MAG TPA: RDD family protein [Candidatus Acidoferrales bacterium]|nr:RDD family protein [Candidatus Acidoferrales bacterium]
MPILRKIGSRTKEFKDVWKPISLILFAIGAVESFNKFHDRSGPYFWGSLSMAILAAAILYTVDTSAGLLAKRIAAFAIDVLLLGLVTFGGGSLLFDTGIVRPSSVTSMIVVWTWIFAFVVLDWSFAGTPGLRIMGLRLHASHSQRPSFLDSLARNLLTFVVPLSIAGSVVSIVAPSNRTASVEWSIAVAVVSFFPLSIIFSGGQALSDLFLGMTVRPERTRESQPLRMNWRRWLSLVLSTLLMGAIVGFAPSMRGLLAGGKQSQFPNLHFDVSGEEESRIAAGLWPRIQAGVPAAEEFLQDVHVYSIAGGLPGDELDPAGAPCQQASAARPIYKLVRMQFAPGTPVIISNALLANMANTAQRFAVGRPGFLVTEVSTKKSFGVFDTELSEDYTYCLAGSDSIPRDTLVGFSRHVVVQGSLNTLAWLFLGDFGKYSYAEKIPVYP